MPGHKRIYYLCKCDCGNIKEIMGNNLKSGLISSCGECNFNSKGEYIISEILNKNNINYKHDYCLEDFFNKTNRRLRFDFIIYDNLNNIERIVEFDGNQHLIGMWGGSWSNIENYETIHERDLLKNKYCFENNIPLIRIPYYKLKTLTLEDIMSDTYRLRGDENVTKD